MKDKPKVMPKVADEANEADWRASPEGRDFVKQKALSTGKKRETTPKGSRLVAKLNNLASVQIALRLPNPISPKHGSWRRERALDTRHS
ncbi:MAG: hypothetical protein SFV54_15175 [Bryobacteraceae bacterium]|nr:hypothetical protein [Bryobacteraceae bacterium]